MSRKFVEHGEYEKSYYGTSLEAIRSVVALEKICVLNLHPQRHHRACQRDGRHVQPLLRLFRPGARVSAIAFCDQFA